MDFSRIYTGVVPVLFFFCAVGCRFDGLLVRQNVSPVAAAVPAVPAATEDTVAVQTVPEPRVVPVADATFARDATATFENLVITEDSVWSGRIAIHGTVSVSPQVTLTITPGTVVAFSADHTGDTAGALLVRGRLVVSGTAEQPVIFRSGSLSAEPGSWRGLVFVGSGKNNLLAHAKITGAHSGVDVFGSTVALRSVVVSSCRVGFRSRASLVTVIGGETTACIVAYRLVDSEADLRQVRVSGTETGVVVNGGSLAMQKGALVKNRTALTAHHAMLHLEQVTFAQNTAGLSCVSCEGTIVAGRVEENYEYGLSLKDSRLRVADNVISRNTGVGVIVKNGSSAAWGNIFSFNGLYDIYNAGTDDFSAVGNWWRTHRNSEISRRIFDRSDDPARGIVETTPLLAAEPAVGNDDHQ